MPREIELLVTGHTAMHGQNQYLRVKSSQSQLIPHEVWWGVGAGRGRDLRPFSAQPREGGTKK